MQTKIEINPLHCFVAYFYKTLHHSLVQNINKYAFGKKKQFRFMSVINHKSKWPEQKQRKTMANPVREYGNIYIENINSFEVCGTSQVTVF